MNDEELKIQKGDQIIQTFCKIGFPQKFGAPSLISRNAKIPRKSTPESCRMH